MQDAINKLMVNRTVIIIAHRLSTVKDADVIAVFDKGKLLIKGDMKNCYKLVKFTRIS